MTPEDAEFYVTPAWCVRRLMDAIDPPTGAWLDPCVGTGAIPEAIGWMHKTWTFVDVRYTGYRPQDTYTESYLTTPSRGPFDVCIMNPPFSKAYDPELPRGGFASKALEECDHVYMLQRLCWLGSDKRSDWLRENTPSIYTLPNRPSFTGDGKTDGQDYAWFVWDGLTPAVHVLADTPASERKSDAVPTRNRSQVELFS